MKDKFSNTSDQTMASFALPSLGYGAASLGNLYKVVPDEASFAALEAGWDVGMRYFDTAPFYGFGLSERRLGDFLRTKKKEEYIISTKVGRLLSPKADHYGSHQRDGFCSPLPFEPVYDYTYDGILRSYEDSLQRLGLSKIDILFVHDIGALTHGKQNSIHFKAFVDGGYKALDELRSNGDIKAFGLGVNEWEVCNQVMEHGRFDLFLLAGRYSLLEQESLHQFLPRCLEHGARLVIGGVYNSGILATGVNHAQPAYYNYVPAPQHIREQVEHIENVCNAHDIPLPAAALQFPGAHPAVACVLVGLGCEARVRQTLDLFNTSIPPELWATLKDGGLIDGEAPTP